VRSVVLALLSAAAFAAEADPRIPDEVTARRANEAADAYVKGLKDAEAVDAETEKAFAAFVAHLDACEGAIAKDDLGLAGESYIAAVSSELRLKRPQRSALGERFTAADGRLERIGRRLLADPAYDPAAPAKPKSDKDLRRAR
jgi:hypothetical protein